MTGSPHASIASRTRVGVVGQRPGVDHDGAVPVVAARAASRRVALVVGLAPGELVAERRAALGDVAHDLARASATRRSRGPGVPARRGSVRTGTAPSCRRSHLVQRRPGARRRSRRRRPPARPTSRSSTKRIPPLELLVHAERARARRRPAAAGRAVSRPSDESSRTVRAASPGAARPRRSASRAANTMPIAIASPWVRPANASSRSSACPSVCP